MIEVVLEKLISKILLPKYKDKIPNLKLEVIGTGFGKNPSFEACEVIYRYGRTPADITTTSYLFEDTKGLMESLGLSDVKKTPGIYNDDEYDDEYRTLSIRIRGIYRVLRKIT
jgi:hypothetical protein